MDPWTLRMPRFLRFGAGVVTGLEDHLQLIGEGSVLLVTDAGVEAAGLVDNVAPVIKRSALITDVYPDVEPQPSIGNVQRLVDRARDRRYAAIIALGGGSVIDA